MNILNEIVKKENDYYLPYELKAQREKISKHSTDGKRNGCPQDIDGRQYSGTQSSHLDTPKLETT